MIHSSTDFDTDSPLTLPIFAAHVYYRALQTVPSTIRTYWTSLQNLALSRTIQSFTSRNFSPLLIDDELAVLRDPSTAVGKQLRDNEEFTVKVADNGKEVKVVFVVDEESMELGIKVPSDFPLVGIEVRDVRKVGVTDKMWRAWLLGMQQVIMNQVRPSLPLLSPLCLLLASLTLWLPIVRYRRRRAPPLQAQRHPSLRRCRIVRDLLLDRLDPRPLLADEEVQDVRQQVPCWLSLQGAFLLPFLFFFFLTDDRLPSRSGFRRRTEALARFVGRSCRRRRTRKSNEHSFQARFRYLPCFRDGSALRQCSQSLERRTKRERISCRRGWTKEQMVTGRVLPEVRGNNDLNEAIRSDTTNRRRNRLPQPQIHKQPPFSSLRRRLPNPPRKQPALNHAQLLRPLRFRLVALTPPADEVEHRFQLSRVEERECRESVKSVDSGGEEMGSERGEGGVEGEEEGGKLVLGEEGRRRRGSGGRRRGGGEVRA